MLILLRFLEGREREAAAESAQAFAQVAAGHLSQFLNTRVRSLENFASFIRAETFNREVFIQSAERVNYALPGYRSINWIDPRGTIRWAFPHESNTAALGKNVYDNPLASPSLRDAHDNRVVAVTPPLMLFQGEWGFAIYIPVTESKDGESELLGFLNGVFTLERLVEQALDPEVRAGYEIEIFNGDRQLFPLPSSDAALLPVRAERSSTSILGQQDVHVRGRSWQLVTRPSPDSLMGRLGTLYQAARGVGLMAALALAALAYLAVAKRIDRQIPSRQRLHMKESLATGQRMEAVGRLAGGVAHDFNNMLTTIMGNASMLAMRPALPDEDRARLEQIQAACDRATAMTAQLLAFDRKGSQERKQIAVEEEVRELQPLLRALIPAGIEFEVDTRAASSWIGISPAQLAQLLTNLVSNAVDASRARGLIRVELLELPQERKVRITVTDNGEGMNAETLRRAAEPFFTTKAEGHGTGLGLASVARIMQQAQGTFCIDSKLGEGTRVVLELPWVDAPELREQASQPTAEPLRSLQVLVVEDKASVREVTCAMLHGLGHRTAECDSAGEALRVHQTEGPFDLVLSDVQMPGGTGVELTAKLRERGYTGPVILFSGYAEDVDAKELEALGAEFLAKPFRRSSLERAIERAFRPGN